MNFYLYVPYRNGRCGYFSPTRKVTKSVQAKAWPKGIRFDNIPTKLRLVASLILYIVQYGIIDSGSAGRFSPHKSGYKLYRLIITDYFQLSLEKSQ